MTAALANCLVLFVAAALVVWAAIAVSRVDLRDNGYGGQGDEIEDRRRG